MTDGFYIVEYWLNLLPDKYRKKALYNYKNTKKNHENIYVDSMHEAINSFVWSETKEGHDFWDAAETKFYNTSIPPNK